MKQARLLFLLIAALTTISCRQSANESSSESSTSDSAELKKQEAWESAHRLDSMGNHREALIVLTQRNAYSTKDSDVTLRTNRTLPTSILTRRHRCVIWHCVTALILTW